MPEEHYLAPMIRAFLASQAGQQLIDEPETQSAPIRLRKACKPEKNFIKQNKQVRPRSKGTPSSNNLLHRTIQAESISLDCLKKPRTCSAFRNTSTGALRSSGKDCTASRMINSGVGQRRGRASSSEVVVRPASATFTPLLPLPRRNSTALTLSSRLG